MSRLPAAAPAMAVAICRPLVAVSVIVAAVSPAGSKMFAPALPSRSLPAVLPAFTVVTMSFTSASRSSWICASLVSASDCPASDPPDSVTLEVVGVVARLKLIAPLLAVVLLSAFAVPPSTSSGPPVPPSRTCTLPSLAKVVATSPYWLICCNSVSRWSSSVDWSLLASAARLNRKLVRASSVASRFTSVTPCEAVKRRPVPTASSSCEAIWNVPVTLRAASSTEARKDVSVGFWRNCCNELRKPVTAV